MRYREEVREELNAEEAATAQDAGAQADTQPADWGRDDRRRAAGAPQTRVSAARPMSRRHCRASQVAVKHNEDRVRGRGDGRNGRLEERHQ